MRRWTQQEREYLEEQWGARSVCALARSLGRSEIAVRARAQKWGLGPHLAADGRVSAISLIRAAFGPENARHTLARMKNLGMPTHRHRTHRASWYTADIDEFWAWAEAHQDKMSFARMEPGALGAEPEWATRKREADRGRPQPRSRWSADEDNRLRALLKEGRHGYLELCERLGRPAASIKRRIYDLYIQDRPVRTTPRPWTTEERERMTRMIREGHSDEAVGRALGRSASAVRRVREWAAQGRYR